MLLLCSCNDEYRVWSIEASHSKHCLISNTLIKIKEHRVWSIEASQYLPYHILSLHLSYNLDIKEHLAEFHSGAIASSFRSTLILFMS